MCYDNVYTLLSFVSCICISSVPSTTCLYQLCLMLLLLFVTCLAFDPNQPPPACTFWYLTSCGRIHFIISCLIDFLLFRTYFLTFIIIPINTLFCVMCTGHQNITTQWLLLTETLSPCSLIQINPAPQASPSSPLHPGSPNDHIAHFAPREQLNLLAKAAANEQQASVIGGDQKIPDVLQSQLALSQKFPNFRCEYTVLLSMQILAYLSSDAFSCCVFFFLVFATFFWASFQHHLLYCLRIISPITILRHKRKRL